MSNPRPWGASQNQGGEPQCTLLLKKIQIRKYANIAALPAGCVHLPTHALQLGCLRLNSNLR